MKKQIVTILASALLITGLSACSNNNPINGTIAWNYFDDFFYDNYQHDSLSLDVLSQDNSNDIYVASMNFYDDEDLAHVCVRLDNQNEIDTCNELIEDSFEEDNEEEVKDFLTGFTADRVYYENISDNIPDLKPYTYNFDKIFTDGYEFNTYYKENDKFYIVLTNYLTHTCDNNGEEYSLNLSLAITATYYTGVKIDNENFLYSIVEQGKLTEIFVNSVDFVGITY